MKGLLLAFVFLLMNLNFAKASPRIEIPINNDWKFSKGNFTAAYEIDFNDSNWETVCLPHTWNNLDGQDGGGDYYRGPAWYRNHFIFSKEYSEKRAFIKFGAAGMIADVYINGKFVGEHKGGFAAFAFDITAFLNFRKPNVVAVKVDNTSPKDSEKFQLAPLDADFTMDGGLYRTVELIVTNDIHISLLDYASPGLYITQEKVTHDSADLLLTTKLRNDSKSERNISVTASIYDHDGKLVRDVKRKARIAVGSDFDLKQEMMLADPHLWDGKIDPYLYRVVVSLYQGTRFLDRIEQPLGLRYYRVDPEKGFFLNGKPYRLHGYCLHEDKEDEGRALSAADRMEEINNMLDIGATFVRLAHYQHDEEMYRLCDKYGIVVWTEIPLIDYIDTTKSFEENCKQQLTELIRQNYNHPSIICWGIFNEIDLIKGPDPTALVKELNELAGKEDPTRPTTSAAYKDDAPPACVTDVLGLNKYFGWYIPNVQGLGPFLDRWHKQHPDRKIGISEYGAGASVYQHVENPTDVGKLLEQPKTDGPWHPEEYQTYFHEESWKAIEARSYIWFSTVWNGFDFSVDSRKEGFRAGVNDKGLTTQDHSTKKDAYYWYKVNWNPAPMVYITSKRFTVRDTSVINVKVYSNAEEVELFVNGKSIGKTKSDDHRFIWNRVKLEEGSNDVKAVMSINGKEYSDECWWRH
jgi:beta-galactosidase